MTVQTSDSSAFEDEVCGRWAGTDAWSVAPERARGYGPAAHESIEAGLDAAPVPSPAL
jgi:hypothetical protein